MKMKIAPVYFACLLLLTGFAIAQTPKGVVVTSAQQTGVAGKTWAVIVGISKYKNVQSLNYADRDAQAFYDYLTAAEGGPKVDTAQVKMLKNERADALDVFAALDWLSGSVKENDRVIFYFSGHGALETKTNKQNGFLLAYDSPIAAYMACGTIGVSYLQDYLGTYITDNKAKDVILFVDACRSGKLAGGDQGLRVTMHTLGEEWNNQVIKILSAQEGEVSYEDKKWGGGRGVFSYYLMRGIEGLADRNNDNKITIAELAAYLPTAVGDATGNTQNPKIDGNPQDVLFRYDAKMLASLKNDEPPAGQIIAATGRGTPVELPPDIKADYQKYLDYLHQGRLLWGATPADTINCARHIYWELVGNPQAQNIRASLKSSFIAALLRKTNDHLEKYLKDEPKVASGEAFREIDYVKKLISPQYVLYNYVLARSYYMASLFAEKLPEKVRLVKKTLELESDAPYAWNQLGSYYAELKMPDSAMACFNKALVVAPAWSFPFLNIGKIYDEKKDYEKAILNYQKAIVCDTNVALAYKKLGDVYYNLQNYSQAILYYKKTLTKDSVFASAYYGLGQVYTNQKDFPAAIREYKNALQLDSAFSGAWYGLGRLYIQQQDDKGAAMAFRKAIKFDSTFAYAIKNLGDTYYHQKDYPNAILYYQQSVHADTLFYPGYYNLGYVYSILQDYKKAITWYNQCLNINPGYAEGQYELGLNYLYDKDYQAAVLSYEEAIKLDSANFYYYDGAGQAYLKLREYKKAAKNYQKATLLHPRDAQNLGNLALCYYYLKDYDNCIQTYQTALKIDSTNADYYTNLGYAYIYSKLFKHGLLCLQIAVSLSPANPYAYYNLACGYALTGDDVKGLDSFKQALQKGYKDYAFIQQDEDLANLKKLPEFDTLMKQFFPDKIK